MVMPPSSWLTPPSAFVVAAAEGPWNDVPEPAFSAAVSACSSNPPTSAANVLSEFTSPSPPTLPLLLLTKAAAIPRVEETAGAATRGRIVTASNDCRCSGGKLFKIPPVRGTTERRENWPGGSKLCVCSVQHTLWPLMTNFSTGTKKRCATQATKPRKKISSLDIFLSTLSTPALTTLKRQLCL